MDIQVQRMYRFGTHRPLKAFADIIIEDCILIKGVKVLEGKNGLFVSMPQEQAKDRKWYDTVRCLTQDVREQITEKVLEAYTEEDLDAPCRPDDQNLRYPLPEREIPDSFDEWRVNKARNKS
jgi:stage V sporulation protein G